MFKDWKVKALLGGLGLIVGLALFSAYPLLLLILACAAGALWAGARAGRAGMALLVPVAAGLLGWAFAAAAQGWLEIAGKETQAVIWWSWLTLDPLSNPANRAGRVGVVAGSLLGLAAPWIAGYLSGWGEKHSPTRVHGLRVADSAAKGTSRWAGEADITHVAEFGPPYDGKFGGGTVVGMFAPFPKLGEKPRVGLFGGGRIVRIRPEKCVPPLPAHAAVVAGTGAGKSYSFVIPNAVAAACEGESLVVTDPKGELTCLLAPWFRAKGYEVYVFNLAEPQWGNCWNPLFEPRDDREMSALAYALIMNAPVKDKGSGYFIMKELQLLKALMYLLRADFPESQAHLRSVLTLLAWPEEKLDERFQEAYQAGRISQTAYEQWQGAISENYGNAVSGLSAKLDIIRAESLARLLSRREIDLSAVGRKKAALFCVLPIGEGGELRPILASFYFFFFRRLYSLAAECGGRLPVATRFLLDEFPNVGQIPGFTQIISTARSLGIKIQFVLQGLKQLADVYGAADMENILANCPIQIFAGGEDATSTSYFSRRLGEAAVWTVAEKHDLTVPGKHLLELPRRTMTIVRRPLMEPEELSRMHPLATVVLTRWCLPMYLRKVDWETLPQAREIKQSAVKTLADVVPRREIALDLPPIPMAESPPQERERRRTRVAEPEWNRESKELERLEGELADLFRAPDEADEGEEERERW